MGRVDVRVGMRHDVPAVSVARVRPNNRAGVFLYHAILCPRLLQPAGYLAGQHLLCGWVGQCGGPRLKEVDVGYAWLMITHGGCV